MKTIQEKGLSWVRLVCMDDLMVGKATPISALRELVDLLEDYSPMWYSEDIRERALAALKPRPVN